MIDSWINGLLVDCLCELMQEPEAWQIYNVNPDYEPEGASGQFGWENCCFYSKLLLTYIMSALSLLPT